MILNYRSLLIRAMLAVVAVVAMSYGPYFAQSAPLADICPEPNDSPGAGCSLPAPDARGTTVRGRFDSDGDVDAYRFTVPSPGALARITLSDLWTDARIQLADVGRGVMVTDVDVQGPADGQFRPPRVIVQWLEPGSYAALAHIVAGGSPPPSYDYTLRVALGPRPTGGPSSLYPESARGYQLTLTVEPELPQTFSLMTFTANIEPPFTDLFDFTWTIDGQTIAEQGPVVQLPRPSAGSHTLTVVARGARLYPDPNSTELPPTLSTGGAFEVR
ncbi:MAG: hypothetical protein ACKVVP_10805 [Chloroflexota bacterium]